MKQEITINKLKATLNCIKDSETILGGEYFKVHSDYIYALEEEINKIDNSTIIIKIADTEEIKNILEKNEKEIVRLNNIIKTAIRYIRGHKEERMIYEPYGTPTGMPNKFEHYVKGYHDLLDILEIKDVK